MSGYDGGNTTGFASPAADYIEGRIDIEEYLELRQPSRYLVRVVGQALESRAVKSGDLLVVDSAKAPTPGQIAVVMIGGATLVGELARKANNWWLRPGLANKAPRRIEGEDSEIWGVAVALVRTDV